MKKIAVKRSDGGVSIVCPASEATPELMERDALSVDGYVSHREIDDSAIPSDRVFRNAWTDDMLTPTIDVDIVKAKEIKKTKMRELRKPKLEDLDVQFMVALESGADVTVIKAKKQELRDVTKLVLPDDVAQLKAFMPDCLK